MLIDLILNCKILSNNKKGNDQTLLISLFGFFFEWLSLFGIERYINLFNLKLFEKWRK
jgi:hypothetical protein